MIKIINGTYGYRNSDGRVEAKTPKSKPFSLSEEREAELVDTGVAEYVNGAPATSEDNRDKVNGDMTVKELTAIAHELGADVPKKATKAQLLEIIEKAQHESPVDDEDDEDDEDDDADPDGGAPAPSAQMPE